MFRVNHRAIAFALLLPGCGGADDAFEFVARFDAAGSVLVVDGTANPNELSYTSASYESARAELVLSVSIETSQGSATTTLRPGICADQLSESQLDDLGQMLREVIALRVIDGATPTLAASGYECVGTELRIWTGS